MIFNLTKKFLQKKSIQNVAYTYTGSVVNGLSLFLINVLLARMLSKDIFGIFSLAVLSLGTVAEMSDFGLDGGLTRFAPYYLKNKQIDKLKQLVKTIWGWRVWMSAVLTFGGIILADVIAKYIFGQEVLTNYLRVSFLGIAGVVLLGFTSTYLKASEKFRYNSVIQILKGVVRLLVIALLLFMGVTNIFVFLGVYIIVPWILFFVTYGQLPKDFEKVQIEEIEKKKMHKQLANFSFWLTVWSFSAIISSRVDQVMLSHMLGLADVAIYSSAFQFVFFYSILQQSISAVLMPKASALSDSKVLIAFVKKVFYYIIPLLMLLAVVIYFSQYLFVFFFGEKYMTAIPVYLVLSYSMLVSIFQVSISFIPHIYNKTHLIAFSGFLQLIINLALNFYFIPRYGVIGAAFTFLLGVIISVVYNVICSVYLVKNKNISVV